MSTGHAGGPGRDAVVEELRALGLLALDRLDPLVGRLAEAVSGEPEVVGTSTGHRCTACPICAALAEVRTDRAEALAQVAQHAAGLLAALRVALAQDAPGEPAASKPERVVQHIPVERVAPC